MALGFFSSADMASFRALAESAMSDTCTIQRNVTTKTNRGGSPSGWTNTYTNVPCRISAHTERRQEQELGEEIRPLPRFDLHLPAGQTIDPTMRVVVNGHTYEVVKVDDGLTYQASVHAVLMRTA